MTVKCDCKMHYSDRNGIQDQMKKKKTYGHPSLIENKCICNHHHDTPIPHHKSSQHEIPKIFICFKSSKTKHEDDKHKKDTHHVEKPKKTKKTKSRELLASILHVGCECERRNGLQDQCPRSECRGAPECMTVPPTCGPSEFSQGKHMTKHYEKSRKEREEFIKKWNEKQAEAEKHSEKKHAEKVEYSCFPIEHVVPHSSPCPVCERHTHGSHHKRESTHEDVFVLHHHDYHHHKHEDDFGHHHHHQHEHDSDHHHHHTSKHDVRPFLIELPADCFHCPPAS